MEILKRTRIQIALGITYSLIVLGMIGYILEEGIGKHPSTNTQQDSLQITHTVIRSGTIEAPTITTIIATPCSVRDIRTSVVWHAATGTLLGEILYKNTGTFPCSLLGYPMVQLKDEHGFLYQIRVTHYTHLYEQYSTDKPVAVILEPNTTTARTSFVWRGCVPAPKGLILVFVTLPHDTTQLLAQDVGYSNGNAMKQVDTPKCSDNETPTNQSALDVGSYELLQK